VPKQYPKLRSATDAFIQLRQKIRISVFIDVRFNILDRSWQNYARNRELSI
jgi:hypothetical protein